MIPDSLKEFMSERFDKEYNGTVGVIASLTVNGNPNASPRHFRIRDDSHLEFTNVFSHTLGEVLSKTPQVTVVFFDPRAVRGFRVRGRASLETFGPLFQQAAKRLEEMGFKPKALVSIDVDEVQSLTFGAGTGTKIS